MRYRIGLDLGIASVGWAVLRVDEYGKANKIIDLGSRIFEKAEMPKDGSSLAAKRREARSSRRRTRRRRHRVLRVKELLEEYNIMQIKDIEKMYEEERFLENVYVLRLNGIEKKLTDKELVRVLISFVKKRGYKSNSKSEESADKELGKLLTATKENEKLMKEKGYRTIAEMYVKDSKYKFELSNGVKVFKVRNTTDDYKSTVLRRELEEEIQLILEKQKELNSKITDEFIEKYISIFNSQRNFDEGPAFPSKYGGNQIENMLGICTFEKDEKRAVKATYTFEYFKLLQDINHIKIDEIKIDDNGNKEIGEKIPLSEEQRNKIIELAYKSDNISYSRIKKELKLDEKVRFNMVRYSAKDTDNVEKAYDECEEKTKLKVFQSYHKIRKVLDKVEKGLITKFDEDTLNNIGYALTVYKNDDKRIDYLKENCKELTDEIINALLTLSFSKTGNLSVKAMKKIIPHLEKGLTYDKAVDSIEEYNFKGIEKSQRKLKISLNDLDEDIPNPVVRRSVSQTIKVLNAITNRYGAPDSVNIELGRELSKTFSERSKIEKAQEENRVRNERAKERIENEFKKENVTGQDIIKFKLWEQQDGVCMYSGMHIPIEDLFTENVDVDHIIPYSESFDDTFNNKVLVLASENRMKTNRLPMVYFKEDKPEKIEEYEVRVNNYIKNYKKRQKLLKKQITKDDVDSFKKRNLEDTQYLSRVVYNLIRNNMSFNENENIKIKVKTVNGAITSHIRKRLGIGKIRAAGDKHHAVDAVIIATVSDKLTQEINKYYKQQECKYYNRKDILIDKETGEILEKSEIIKSESERFPEPWPKFRNELEIRTMDNLEYMKKAIVEYNLINYTGEDIEKLKTIFVSKMPYRKVTGAAHKDTVRGLKIENGKSYSVTKTMLTKLKPICDKEKQIIGIEGYSEKLQQDDKYLYLALLKRLKEFGGNAEEAFKEKFYRPDKNGNPGPLVKKVKIEKVIGTYVPINENKSLSENDNMVRVDIFYVEKEGYYMIPIYVADTIKKELPNKAVVSSKTYSEWKEMSDDNFIFSLYPNDLIKLKFKKNMEFVLSNQDERLEPKSIQNDVMCYYNSSDVSTASIKVKLHDNSYEKRGIGIKTLPEIKKYEVDVLGYYHEISLPEKRMKFNIKK